MRKQAASFVVASAIFLISPSAISAWEAPRTSLFATENLEIVGQQAAKVAYDRPQGLWSFPDDDSEVAIVPASDADPDIYKIVMLYDADMIPPRGTVIGYLAPTASGDKWHAWLYASVKDRSMESPREFAVTFRSSPKGEEASLIFEKIKKKGISWRINPLALIPFVRRLINVRLNENSERLPYGLYRKNTIHRLRWL